MSTGPTLSPRAIFRVPGPDDTAASLLSRWSDTYVSLPAAFAVPSTESDIGALVSYAKANHLKVVASGGQHLPSVPVTSKTLYIDMKSFDSIQIDEEARTVSIGGGVTTGALLSALTDAGYFTSLPNTNTVGVVGAFLGGGSSPLNGVTGFMVDQAVAARVITAEGRALTLGPDSKGDEAALWHALRGAGHGLAVVSGLTLRIHPIRDLGMDDDKLWSRTLVLPGLAIGVAAHTFEKLQPVQGPIALNLIITRNLPGTPGAGSPLILLTASYFGPSADAEKALAPLLDNSEINEAAVHAATSFLPMSALNDGTKMVESRGGLKRSDATLLRDPVDAAAIERSFERFVKLGDGCPDAMHSAVVYYAFDPSALANAPAAASERGFFEGRDTRCIVYHDIWFTEEASAGAVDAYLPQAIAIARVGESGPMRRFANFLQYPADLEDCYSTGKAAEKRRVKQVWDPEGVFWTPGL